MTDQERMEQERFELERIEKQFARCKYPVVYEEIRTEEIMLKMTDGVLLRTILLRPEVEGQVPVIVVRTCYPNNDYIYRVTAMENAGYPVNADYIASCRFQPHVEVDEKLWGKRLDWYRKWVTGTNESDAYWNTGLWGLLKEIPSRVKVPVYIGEGWYDHHLGSAIETYRRLSDECKKKSRFLIGAWDHNFNVAVEGHQGEHFENDDILRAFYWFYQLLVEEKEPQGSVDTYIIGDDSREVFCSRGRITEKMS